MANTHQKAEDFKLVPFLGNDEGRDLAETYADRYGGVVIEQSVTGGWAAAVPKECDTDKIEHHAEPEDIERIKHKLDPRSFRDYLADEYGYHPESPLWSEGGDGDAELEVATSFYKRLTPFTDDDHIEVVYARIDQTDGDLYIGLGEA